MLIQHGGVADRPLALLITADKVVADSFRIKSVEDIANPENVFTKVHLLAEKEFREVATFVARESTKLTEPEWALEPSAEFGTFGVSSRTKTDAVAGFFFVLSPRDSRAFFERLFRFLVGKGISTELQREVNGLSEWMNRAVQLSR